MHILNLALSAALFCSINLLKTNAFAETSSEGEAPEAAEKNEDSKSTVGPWVEVEMKITELRAKIKSKEESILQLLGEKSKLPNNSPQLKATLQKIIKEHQELRGLAADYQKNLSILRFRYPERNVKSGRHYERIEIRSIDQMETAMGIEGKLNRNMQRMRSQFSSEETKNQGRAGEGEPVLTGNKPPGQKHKSIEDAENVILQK